MAEITVSFNEALAAAVAALKAAGASPAHAAATGRALVTAEAEGNRGVGLKHLFAYRDALAAGRARGEAESVVEEVTEVVTRVDAAEGLPHLGFELALPRLSEGAERLGLALLTLSNGYPCGALGYFARKLAEEHGFAALVAANAGPAVMAASGGKTPVFCTNPIAFAVPRGTEDAPALVIDQSSSSSSLAKLREYAEAGREIPEGWGLDPAGHPTTDARAALAGSLLPFGGARGANIALMVEMLAAGLTGANWSKDAPAFNKGAKSPGAGLFVLAVSPVSGFHARLHDWFEAVQADEGVHLPGLAKGEALHHARHRGFAVDAELWTRVKALA
ncbi:Ldh family oxidoreductase [Pelagibius sp. CAU 1746]|uniref:Ldh family oxidoreductase n=1 Tax=Pelagibius sp. CAU 1746 TaxID=3140370 RepID=UPI00325A6018